MNHWAENYQEIRLELEVVSFCENSFCSQLLMTLVMISFFESNQIAFRWWTDNCLLITFQSVPRSFSILNQTHFDNEKRRVILHFSTLKLPYRKKRVRCRQLSQKVFQTSVWKFQTLESKNFVWQLFRTQFRCCGCCWWGTWNHSVMSVKNYYHNVLHVLHAWFAICKKIVNMMDWTHSSVHPPENKLFLADVSCVVSTFTLYSYIVI